MAGLLTVGSESAAVVRLVVELSERGRTWPRLPDDPDVLTLEGIEAPRLALDSGHSAKRSGARGRRTSSAHERPTTVEQKGISLEHCAAVHKNGRLVGSLPASIDAVRLSRLTDGSLMIGMVLVTHGQLAIGFRAALEHVVGPQSQLETITIGPEDDMEQRRSDILNAAARVQDGAGVVILTDMFGGTPSNLAISVMDGGRIEVICGVNLPMLIKLATLRETADLDHAVVEAREAGRKYITVASKVLAGK